MARLKLDDIDVKIFSGFKIQYLPDPRARHVAFQQLIKELQILAAIVPLWQQEIFLFDDASKHLSPQDLLLQGIEQGEFLVPIDKTTGKIIGTARLTEILPHRHAILEGWLMPEYRGTKAAALAWRWIRNYCFHPKLLNLMKLKVAIAAANTPALHAVRSWRFQEIGRSPSDAFHNGVPCDSVLLELHNPAIFGTVVESIADVIKAVDAENAELHPASILREPGGIHSTGEQRTAGELHESGKLHQPGTISAAPESAGRDTTGAEPADDDDKRGRRRPSLTKLAANRKRKSIGPGGTPTVRK